MGGGKMKQRYESYKPSGLKRLKHTTDTRYFAFRDYLEKVRSWRNEEAHSAPEMNDSDLRAAIHILMTMYVYVVARSISDLEHSHLLS